MSTNPTLEEQVAAHTQLLERALLEAQQSVAASVFHPFDELFDPATGDRWLPLGSGGSGVDPYQLQFATEQDLAMARMACRYLGTENGHAINCLENMVSYVVGGGMTIKVVPKPGGPKPAKDSLAPVQEWLDEWAEEQAFDEIQQEIVKRAERDGECFVRRFYQDDGQTELRFVEPGLVRAPTRRSVALHSAMERSAFGVQTADGDAEDVEGYWVDDDLVPADEVFHLRLNVDSGVRRGIPTLWPIRMNLHRAFKLMRFISAQTLFISSIAGIRQHENTSKSAMATFADERTDYTRTDPDTGNSKRVQKLDPGRIIDISSKIKMEFPVVGQTLDKMLEVMSAELRAAASRLVFPEFMFTSDASNANMASSVVSEGPAGRMFGRRQKKYGRHFRSIVADALAWAAERGAIPADLHARSAVSVVGPEVESRDPLVDAQAKQIQFQSGVLSAQTWSAQCDLDWEQEQANIDAHAERAFASVANQPQLPTPGPPQPR